MTLASTTRTKPFTIDKWLVYEAYQAVKSNKGAAGVDGETIEQFEANLNRNLYKLWNRMSSGTYFLPPVRAVSIPKKSGGERILGVPIRCAYCTSYSVRWDLNVLSYAMASISPERAWSIFASPLGAM